MSASLSMSSWPPGLSPSQALTNLHGLEPCALPQSSSLRLSAGTDATALEGCVSSKWSPSSSLSGETELEVRSQRSLSDEQKVVASRAPRKEKVGGTDSFFDLAPLSHELQSLEEEVATHVSPLMPANTKAGPLFASSTDFEAERHSMDFPTSSISSESDSRSSIDMNERAYQQQMLLQQRRVELEKREGGVRYPQVSVRLSHQQVAPVTHHPNRGPVPTPSLYDERPRGHPVLSHHALTASPSVPYNVPNPAARIAQHNMYHPNPHHTPPLSYPTPLSQPPSYPAPASQHAVYHVPQPMPHRMTAPGPMAPRGYAEEKHAHIPRPILPAAAYPVAHQAPNPYGPLYSSAPPPPPSNNPGNGRIFHVQFKGTVRHFILGSQAPVNIPIGEFVVVEADRGEDVGIVTDILSMKAFIEMRHLLKHSVDEEDSTIGRIVRIATASERHQLKAKTHDEHSVMQFCRELAHHTYRLPLIIHDAEYQFDRHKLTIYYQADTRVDFRELVRDLFSAFKARIWMKRVNAHQPFRLDDNASLALATGIHQPVTPPPTAYPHY